MIRPAHVAVLAAFALGIAVGLLLAAPSDARAPRTAAGPRVLVPLRLPAPVIPAAPAGEPDQAPRRPVAAVEPDASPAPATAAPRATPASPVRPAQALQGTASWFGAPAGTAAAGRPLRAFLGRGWRHDRVRVCGPAGCARVVLSDWMGNPRRVVDLSPGAFVSVCGPLSRGVCRVTVERVR